MSYCTCIVCDRNPLVGDGLTKEQYLALGHVVLMERILRADDGRQCIPTGDVASWDVHGYIRITDRTKDVIKSGGEWVSSIELENAAAAHPGVSQVAVIGVHHPKWEERPLMLIVRAPQATLTREEMLAFLRGRIADWQIPDDVHFLDAMPLTATGKIRKATLREMYEGFSFGHHPGGS